MKNNNINARLVYSTEHGTICPECAHPVSGCVCRSIKKSMVSGTDGVVRLRYETKGRKGKGMTLISGLALNETQLLELAKKLKQKFGTGGAVKDYIIELQGDFRHQAEEELRKLGYL